MAHDAFISYSTKDSHFADTVRAYFEQDGMQCWMAPHSIPVGKQYAVAIEEALEECKLFVLILSSNANDSDHVKNEIELAFHNKLSFLTIRIEDVKPAKGLNYYLQRTQWLDAIKEPKEAQIELLVQQAKKVLGFTEAEKQITEQTKPSQVVHTQPTQTAATSFIDKLKTKQGITIVASIFAVLLATVITLSLVKESPESKADSPDTELASEVTANLTPEEVVNNFYKAFTEEDFKKAAPYLAENFLTSYELTAEDWISNLEDNVFKNGVDYTDYKVSSIEDYDETRKMVKALLKVSQNGTDSSVDENISLVLEDGQWRIDPSNLLKKESPDVYFTDGKLTFENFTVERTTDAVKVLFKWTNETDKNLKLGWVKSATAVLKTSEGSYTAELANEELKANQYFDYSMGWTDAKGDIESITIQGLYYLNEKGLSETMDPFQIVIPFTEGATSQASQEDPEKTIDLSHVKPVVVNKGQFSAFKMTQKGNIYKVSFSVENIDSQYSIAFEWGKQASAKLVTDKGEYVELFSQMESIAASESKDYTFTYAEVEGTPQKLILGPVMVVDQMDGKVPRPGSGKLATINLK